jgi:uncharacterized repeat protein (TIGR03803 family)
LDPAGLETVLYGFRGEADGAAPQRGALTLDSSGNLYGTTQWGGAEYGSTGFGVVYQVSPAGQETVLYTFTGGTDGASPESGVTLDSAGDIYGTASLGGSQNEGVVFKLTP